MAVLSGLGFFGRNNLIIHPDLGTRFIIAGCLVPENLLFGLAEAANDAVPADQKRCETCSACIEACPTGALSKDPYPQICYDKHKCIQYHTTRLEEPPEKVKLNWGKTLYGCGLCQEACPYNRNLGSVTVEGLFEIKGAIGPSLSLSAVLSMQDDDLKRFLNGSALGMNWFPPLSLKRNALLAAGSIRKKGIGLPETLRTLIDEYRAHPVSGIRAASEWASPT